MAPRIIYYSKTKMIGAGHERHATAAISSEKKEGKGFGAPGRHSFGKLLSSGGPMKTLIIPVVISE
jgi:hypothetical protein